MKVLIIDDNLKDSCVLGAEFKERGFLIKQCFEGNSGIDCLQDEKFNFVIIECHIKDFSGQEVASEVRKLIPEAYVIGTSHDRDPVTIACMLESCDDFVIKPATALEYIARFRAIMRRSGNNRGTVIKHRDLVLDPISGLVTQGGKVLDLTSKEMKLIEFFMYHPGNIISRARLLDEVWDGNVDSFSNTIDVHVGRLRRKLAQRSHRPYIRTIPGRGYQLVQ